ncbi:MAG: hypothetical protein GY715_05945 [Planctomycetes bacterium]|nr:hypothetical protein [Planctomycetota bacterium]
MSGPSSSPLDDPVTPFRTLRLRGQTRRAERELRQTEQETRNERSRARHYARLAGDLAAEAGRIQRHIDRLHLTSVRATAPAPTAERPADPRPAPEPPRSPAPADLTHVPKLYAPRPVGCVTPSSNQAPPPAIVPEVANHFHVTNLGTLLDVLA